MGRNFYQLVAIDEERNEYIIGLKNSNKENKGHLSLIDYGTSFFKNEEQMRIYFESKKEDFPKNCEFKIKYIYSGEIKYVSCIYDEPLLKDEIRKKYLQKDNKFERINTKQTKYDQRVLAIKLFEVLEKLLKDEKFFEMFVLYEKNRLGMSNILNQKIQESIHKYTYLINLPILDQEEEKEKNELRFSIIRELEQYRQFRTLYLLVKNYKNGQLRLDIENIENNLDYIEYMKSNEKKEGTWDFDEELEIPEDVKYSYDKGDMDEVYQNFDLDDLIGKGLRR